MILTPYGFFAGLGVFVSLNLLPVLKYEYLIICMLAIILQSYLCVDCKNLYSLASYLSILPILLLFIADCSELKNVLVILSLALAIGRIGCFFAGCCSGKVCPKSFLFPIYYKKGSVVVDKYVKQNTQVYPTIFIEILSQFLITYLVWKLDYGIVLFGILNAALVYSTGYWRLASRMGNSILDYIPVISLLCFSIIGYYKCKKQKSKKLTYQFKPISLVFSFLTAFILSNDINFGLFM